MPPWNYTQQYSALTTAILCRIAHPSGSGTGLEMCWTPHDSGVAKYMIAPAGMLAGTDFQDDHHQDNKQQNRDNKNQ
jgi:hypothetical protein